MRRTRLTVITALILVAASLGTYAGRRAVLGTDLELPRGSSAWRVTLKVSGELAKDETTVNLMLPLDFRRQHVYSEHFDSRELLHRQTRDVSDRDPNRREKTWRRQGLMGGRQPFTLTYTFRCVLGIREPTPAMNEVTDRLDAAPTGDSYLRPTPRAQSDDAAISKEANDIVPADVPALGQVREFYESVARLPSEPSLDAGLTGDDPPRDPARSSGNALDCLQNRRGDAGAKSRLLVALCRNRGIPARVVCGLILINARQQVLHVWAEAYVNHYWLSMDPVHKHFGSQFPTNYLVFRFGDDELLRGTDAPPRYGFLVQALSKFGRDDGGPLTRWQRYLLRVSFYQLPPAEQHLVRFLLMLPPAALVVAIFRTLIGVPTYGTFSPALLGLVFLDLKALPWGLSIFLLTVLVGWLLRRGLDHYHLLLVPRTSVLLTLIVTFLLCVILVAGSLHAPVTHYLSLFPLVILTHLVERFWTVEAEDGTVTSFKTLLGTTVVAVTISLVLNIRAVPDWLFVHPETLGVIVAAMLLLGRYTGYRASELLRFRDLAEGLPRPEEKASAP